jgi:hypothetical protein
MIANERVRGALPALGQPKTPATIPHSDQSGKELRHRRGHIPSWGETCERPALPPIADASCRLLLLPSSLLSAMVGALVLLPPPVPRLTTGPWGVLPGPLPRTRLLPDLVTDGFSPGRLRVYMNHAALPEAVALRSQTGWTGSGSHRYSYGGFGEATRTSTRIPTARPPRSLIPGR